MIDLNQFEVIFFDFNGTIIDDTDLCLDILNTMLINKSHKPINKDYYLKIFTFPIIEYYKKAGFVFPEDDFPKLAEFYTETYLSDYHKVSLHQGIKELLDNLKDNNKKLYIISAANKNVLTEQLKYFDVEKYFSGISALDNSHGASKIDKAKAFIKDNNIDLSKALLIGDTLHDELTGDELNIPCLLYSHGHQSREVLLTGHSQIFDSFSDLIIK